MTDAELRLRRDASAIFRAALAAVAPDVLVRNALERGDRVVPPGGRLRLVAVGKAALAMARGASQRLGDRVAEGVVLAPRGTAGVLPAGARELGAGVRLHQGGHPLPDRGGMRGAEDILDVVRRAGPEDHILLLLSGGGSALLTLPHPDLSLDDLRRVTELLLTAGADIQELNSVRKHLEVLKGGRLAALAHPASLTALVLSDVVGDPLDVIASGPASPDPSTFADAVDVLERRGVWTEVPDSIREHLLRGLEGRGEETPKEGDPVFDRVAVTIVGNAALAAERAAEEATRLGYSSRVITVCLTGEASVVGAALAVSARELGASSLPACQVSAGETTVTVRGNGRGGRNQELALAAAIAMDGAGGALVLSGGTDGLDGPTDAAGAIATASTLGRARALGLDARDHLARNDSYAFFEALGDLVKTGPTGTNVADLMLVMAR